MDVIALTEELVAGAAVDVCGSAVFDYSLRCLTAICDFQVLSVVFDYDGRAVDLMHAMPGCRDDAALVEGRELCNTFSALVDPYDQLYHFRDR